MRSLLTVVLTSSLLGLPTAACAAKPRAGGGTGPTPSPGSPTAATPKDPTATATSSAASGTSKTQSAGTAPSAKPSIAAAAPAQRLAQRPVGTASRVADANLSAEFNNLSADGDIYFSGWPSEAGLRAMSARGVKTVIALKTPDQVMDARGYDPRAVAKELGIAYVVIPVTPDSYDAAVLDRFAAAFDGSAGPILIHCGSSSTVGGVWSGYLAAKRGVPSDQALDRGRAAGLREGPMTDAAERVIGSTGPQPRK